MEKEILIPAALLDEIIKAIEHYEEGIDGEYGSGRTSDELIEDGDMPELYNKLIAIKNSINN